MRRHIETCLGSLAVLFHAQLGRLRHHFASDVVDGVIERRWIRGSFVFGINRLCLLVAAELLRDDRPIFLRLHCLHEVTDCSALPRFFGSRLKTHRLSHGLMSDEQMRDHVDGGLRIAVVEHVTIDKDVVLSSHIG